MNPLTLPLAHFLRRLRPALAASLLKKLLLIRREVIEVARGSFYADPVSDIGFQLLTTGQYETHMENTLDRYLQHGGVFVDLGANEGYFTVIGSLLVGVEGRVIAVEPQRRLLEVINRNLELNSCQNVTVENLAISDIAETTRLYLSPDVNTGSTGLSQSTRYTVPTQEVQSKTLSELFDIHAITHCDLLKVDIEGWEYEAVLGSGELFQSNVIKNIALEVHPPLLKQRELDESEIIDFLLSCGYTLNHPFGYMVFEK